MLDVAIIGGGPAGLAAATLLARRGRKVAVFERDAYGEPKAGESFGPRLKPLLEQLGAWPDFAALETVPFRGVRSAWGSAEIQERASVVDPLGEGWHVDRARFEEMLVRVATRAGAVVHAETGACVVEPGFVVHGERARFVIDASGRGAPASAQLFPQRTWASIDRQVAVVVRAPCDSTEPELLLESCEQGWWYSVPQPDGTLVLALLTDADLVDRDALPAQLAASVHTKLRAQAVDFSSATVVRADSGFLSPDRAPGFCALGDAAFAGDPLAGDGVERALSSALRACDSIERELDGAPAETSSPPVERLEQYLAARARYYAMERRWSGALYWRRRAPPDVDRAQVTLSPVAQLALAAEPSPHALAPVEALVPRRAVTAALETLRQSAQPAHVVLGALRSAAPLDGKRLVVALQALIASGVVRESADVR